ncbi:MFS transporter [Frigoribacterium sp. ME-P-080]|uniref:MFS transporter n=1 Tax=Frigoribacterium sp. ME-P-080 TaxID=3040289 RepID=UPI00254E3DEF|nr:MFS transporter [Frigoribacterium sp. ME-P-080]
MTAVSRTTAPPSSSGASVASVLDSIGFTRAQFWIFLLILAGEFFNTLEQNSVGAMGSHLKDSLQIGDVQLTGINTATVIGGLIGRLLAGYLADKYGRRFSLGLNLLIYTLGGLLIAVAMNYEWLLVSRLIVGIGIGGEFMIGIVMLSEMVATKFRGTAIGMINVGAGGLGNFISYGLFLLLLGPLEVSLGGPDVVWRWTFVILAVPALLVVLYRRRLPETPRFLLSKGRVDEANRSLAILASNSLRPTDAKPPVQLSPDDLPPMPVHANPAAVFHRFVLRRTVALGVASWMAFGSQVTLNFLMPTCWSSVGTASPRACSTR